jgi:hypothetical protein
MRDHYASDPIALSPSAAEGNFTRADLVFYGVDHREDSFTARVFLDTPGKDPDLSADREKGYAGRFTIFGHGGCFGDQGHCEVPTKRDPFDSRPPHGLTGQTKIVEITEALHAVKGDAVVITVIPVIPSKDGPQRGEVLSFTGLRLNTYL